MTVYVADIGGRGVAAFQADSDSDAERLARDRVFRDDLMVLATGGLPLWDGVSAIEIRQARPGEAAKWRASRARAISQGNIEGADEAWVAFLVALTDPHRRDGDQSSEARSLGATPSPPDLGCAGCRILRVRYIA
jgi:hypothetical protein